MTQSQRVTFQQNVRPILTLMMPILMTQLAQSGYGLVDTIMAGRVSADDLAVVAIGSGIWLPVFLLTLGVLIATTPLLGELIGQKKTALIAYTTQQSLWFALFCGSLAGIVLYFSPLIFGWFDIPAHLLADTQIYIHSVAFGFPAVAMYTTLRCYTESLGRPHPVTVISIMGVLLNIPLNALFIYGYDFNAVGVNLIISSMGGAGCGVATAISMWVTLLCLVVYLSMASAYKEVRFYHQFAKPAWSSIKKIALLGLPIGTAIFFEASLFSIAAVILSPLGSVTVAAHQIGLSVTSQLFMVPLSLALALTILIARLYGEKNWVALARVKRTGFILATGFACVSILMILLCRQHIIALFTTDMAVHKLAMQLLLAAVFYQIVDAWQVTSAGILRGIQDTAAPMWITLFSYWCVGLPIGIYLSRFTTMGALGFWMGLIAGLSMASVLLFWRLHDQQKKLSALSRQH